MPATTGTVRVTVGRRRGPKPQPKFTRDQLDAVTCMGAATIIRENRRFVLAEDEVAAYDTAIGVLNRLAAKLR